MRLLGCGEQRCPLTRTVTLTTVIIKSRKDGAREKQTAEKQVHFRSLRHMGLFPH